MKYIRTKDGILDNWLMDGVMPEAISAQTFGMDAIKYANTIEELCDEFVCGKNHLLLKLYELKSEDFKEDVKDIVYGAIWTDKGLIYVAKMNEKGELELL